jgi:hypothetical protein
MIYKTQDPKYGIKDNKIVNMKTGKPIPDNEPIFIFRAQDTDASDVIHSYAEECSNAEHVKAVLKRWGEFCEFKEDNPSRMKEPDTQS